MVKLKSPWMIFGLLVIVSLKTSLLLLSNSYFHLKFHPLLFVTFLRSVRVKRLISVWKLSPDIVFWIESVSLSMTKSRCIVLSFFTRQIYENHICFTTKFWGCTVSQVLVYKVNQVVMKVISYGVIFANPGER